MAYILYKEVSINSIIDVTGIGFASNGVGGLVLKIVNKTHIPIPLEKVDLQFSSKSGQVLGTFVLQDEDSKLMPGTNDLLIKVSRIDLKGHSFADWLEFVQSGFNVKGVVTAKGKTINFNYELGLPR